MRLLNVKLQKLFSLFKFYVNPNAAFGKWENRTENEAITGYLVNLKSPTNLYLHSLLNRVEYESLCEVGSNVGNRIINLAEIHPGKKFLGTDINSSAIKVGRKYLINKNFSNIRLDVEDLSKPFANLDRYDVVVSWATLLIFPPKRIDIAIRNIASRAGKFVILIEQVMESHQGYIQKKIALLQGFPNYAYDYKEKFSKYGFILVHEEPIPASIWRPGGGRAKALILMRVDEN